MKRFSDLFRRVGEWADETFGDSRTPEGVIKHLLTEVVELAEAPDDIMEYADCLMLVVDGARMAGFSPEALLDAAEAKLKINQQRKWGEPDVNGIIRHIEED